MTAVSTRAALTAAGNKVPEVTLAFWVVKILATTVGETAADFLSTTLGLGLTGTTMVMTAVLLTALGAQITGRRYVFGAYGRAARGAREVEGSQLSSPISTVRTSRLCSAPSPLCPGQRC